jgi:hypothetical protein
VHHLPQDVAADEGCEIQMLYSGTFIKDDLVNFEIKRTTFLKPI